MAQAHLQAAALAQGATAATARSAAAATLVQAAAAAVYNSHAELPASGSRRIRNPNWKDAIRQEDAPALWQKICGGNANSVKRAIAALQSASDREIADARAGSLGLITPVVRAAAARGKRGEAELVTFLQIALQHGLSPNGQCPLRTAWEVFSPPLVAAAAAGFAEACSELIQHGASPLVVDSDGDTAVHAAVEQPHVMTVLLAATTSGDGHGVVQGGSSSDAPAPPPPPPITHPFAACVRAENRFKLTPVAAALTATPFKQAHQRGMLRRCNTRCTALAITHGCVISPLFTQPSRPLLAQAYHDLTPAS